jgi:hypothetical protein
MNSYSVCDALQWQACMHVCTSMHACENHERRGKRSTLLDQFWLLRLLLFICSHVSCCVLPWHHTHLHFELV